MNRTQRPITQAERELLAPRPAARVRAWPPAAKGFAIGAVFSLVMFVVWRDAVWAAGITFSLIGAFFGYLVGVVTEKNAPPRPQRVVPLEVEVLEAQLSGAVVLRDDGDDCWFVQVSDSQVLCLRAPAFEVRELLALVWAPKSNEGEVLSASGAGELVKPLRRRAFRVGEYRPRADAEVLSTTLEKLDEALLRRGPPAPDGPVPPLAEEVAALGFYRFVGRNQVARVKAELTRGRDAWLVAAGRAFFARDADLAEGGVIHLLEELQPTLAREGVVLDALKESFDERAGLVVTVGADAHALSRSGEPVVPRVQALLNGWLEAAGSKERFFVMGPRLVLLTPELHAHLGAARTATSRKGPGFGQTAVAALFIGGFFAALPLWYLSTQDGWIDVRCGSAAPWRCRVEKTNLLSTDVSTIAVERVSLGERSAKRWRGYSVQFNGSNVFEPRAEYATVSAMVNDLETARRAGLPFERSMPPDGQFWLAFALVVLFAGAGIGIAVIGRPRT